MRTGANQRDACEGRNRSFAPRDPEPDTRGFVSGADQLACSGRGVQKPMRLLRVLHAEALKMKRTIALKMVVLCPAVVVLLILFIGSQAPYSTLHRNGIRNEWTQLERLNLRFWAL